MCRAAAGPPPADLSLWVFNGTLANDTTRYRVLVPGTVISADGSRTDFHFMMLGTEGLCVTLLSHPGWPVEHPLVQVGHAWELLHDPPDRGDLFLAFRGSGGRQWRGRASSPPLQQAWPWTARCPRSVIPMTDPPPLT
jgi:hypothetical protein